LEVFDLLINGTEIEEEELLKEISLSSYANILDYKIEVKYRKSCNCPRKFSFPKHDRLLNNLGKILQNSDDNVFEGYIIKMAFLIFFK